MQIHSSTYPHSIPGLPFDTAPTTNTIGLLSLALTCKYCLSSTILDYVDVPILMASAGK